MKTIKVFSFILSFVFFATILHAQKIQNVQMANYKDVLAAKDRQPIVIVNPPNPDVVNSLTKKGKIEVLQAYQQIIGNYNDNMKALVKKFWTFNSKEVLFKTRVELNEMLKDKSQLDKYVLIYCYSWGPLYKSDFDWKVDKWDQIYGTQTNFAIGLPNERPFYLEHVHLIPTPTDLAEYISKANYDFTYILNHKDNCSFKEMISENRNILGKKTLLICKKAISPKVINDVSMYYPCPYKVVDSIEMEHAITTGDPTCAYAINGGGSCYIINCADGASIIYTDKGVGATYTNDFELRKDFFIEIANDCKGDKKK